MKKILNIASGAFVVATMVSPMALADKMVGDDGDSRPAMRSGIVEPLDMPKDMSKALVPYEGKVADEGAEVEEAKAKTKKEIAADIVKEAAAKAAKDALAPLEEDETAKDRAGKIAKDAAEAVADGFLDTVVTPFISGLIEGFFGPDEDATDEAKAKSKADSDATAATITGGIKTVGRVVFVESYNWISGKVSGWFS